MNISDQARLYREIRRMLKSRGRFATFEFVSNSGDRRPVSHHWRSVSAEPMTPLVQ
jgi:ubiquinone/menaquinone biosynthesis C-methylase UbiE